MEFTLKFAFFHCHVIRCQQNQKVFTNQNVNIPRYEIPNLANFSVFLLVTDKNRISTFQIM